MIKVIYKSCWKEKWKDRFLLWIIDSLLNVDQKKKNVAYYWKRKWWDRFLLRIIHPLIYIANYQCMILGVFQLVGQISSCFCHVNWKRHSNFSKFLKSEERDRILKRSWMINPGDLDSFNWKDLFLQFLFGSDYHGHLWNTGMRQLFENYLTWWESLP